MRWYSANSPTIQSLSVKTSTLFDQSNLFMAIPQVTGQTSDFFEIVEAGSKQHYLSQTRLQLSFEVDMDV